MIHAESAVQRGIVRFCKRAIAVPYLLACHDRAKEHQTGQHIFEAARGIRAGWPDAEINIPGPLTVRVELKAPNKKLEPGGAQERIGQLLTDLGHAWGWANSVLSWAEVLERFSVPMLPAWRLIAAHEDELVAADIRKQEAKRDGLVPRGKPVRKKVSAGRTRKTEAVRARLLF